MIKKLRRRYLITNMALLSATLIVCLAILFGILYHAEISSSYVVMQEMIDRADLPRRPPDDRHKPTADTGDDGAVMPLNYVPDTTAPAQGEDNGAPAFTGTFPAFTAPPYWAFQNPGWQAPPWGTMPQPPSGDWNNGGWPGTFPQSQNPGSGTEPKKSDERPPESKTEPAQTQPPKKESKENTDGSDTTPKKTEPPKERHSEPPVSGTDAPPQMTMPWTFPWFVQTTTTETVTEATQTTVTTVTAAAAVTETKPTKLVPVEEGRYVPNAVVADFDDNGNIAAYAGNNEEDSDDERCQAVQHAMDAVRQSGDQAGTVQIGDNSFRYLYHPDAEGNFRLVLLDRAAEQSTLSRLIFIFALILVGGLLCMFGVSMLLANWTVTPVAAAWEKQKQFVADASHELKTPLAVISANTEVILTNPEETVSGQSKWLGYIQSETMRMSKLITMLLSAARMDNSKNERVRPEPINLSETVANVCLVFEPVVYEHDKRMSTVIQRNLSLRADQDDIKQLLSILMENAVLHSTPNAEITVSLSEDAQGKIRLSVANTAKDIPPEQLAHLFDRFYRVDTEGSPNGSGLGLSIARSIVRQNGGNLTVSSENNLVTFVAVLSA